MAIMAMVAMVPHLSTPSSSLLSLSAAPPSPEPRPPTSPVTLSIGLRAISSPCKDSCGGSVQICGRQGRVSLQSRVLSRVTGEALRFSGAGVARLCDSGRSRGSSSNGGAATRCTAGVQGTEELPAKLQEIVRLFQAVEEPRAKYEQLLYYAKKLNPLAEEYCTPENKVQGCVSQVWVVCNLGPDNRVYFETQSDSSLTKGLAALLVEGLSGATVEEVLKVTPDFVHMLGLKQSLTPSRSNGFLNMLKLMQKKTLQLYMESASMSSPRSAAAAAPLSSTTASSPNSEPEQPVASGIAPSQPAGKIPAKPQTMKDSIEKKLTEGLTPVQLEVEDVSYQHAGHAGAPKGSSETHFNVKVVSDSFQGRSLVKRHRLVYELLQDELQNGVHALSLITKTPTEVSAKP